MERKESAHFLLILVLEPIVDVSQGHGNKDVSQGHGDKDVSQSHGDNVSQGKAYCLVTETNLCGKNCSVSLNRLL